MLLTCKKEKDLPTFMNDISNILLLRKGNLLITTSNPVAFLIYKNLPDSFKLTENFYDANIRSSKIYQVSERKNEDNIILCGLDSGLFIYDIENNQLLNKFQFKHFDYPLIPYMHFNCFIEGFGRIVYGAEDYGHKETGIIIEDFKESSLRFTGDEGAKTMKELNDDLIAVINEKGLYFWDLKNLEREDYFLRNNGLSILDYNESSDTLIVGSYNSLTFIDVLNNQIITQVIFDNSYDKLVGFFLLNNGNYLVAKGKKLLLFDEDLHLIKKEEFFDLKCIASADKKSFFLAEYGKIKEFSY